MGTSLTTKPRVSRQMSDSQNSRTKSGRYINIDGTMEKVYTVDEVFSRIEKNLNDFYGTNCKLR